MLKALITKEANRNKFDKTHRLKIFEQGKALPTFLSLRLPNGMALSCGVIEYQIATNEPSSRYIFRFCNRPLSAMLIVPTLIPSA